MNTLQSITDVGITRPLLGHSLVYTGGGWVNMSPINPAVEFTNFWRPFNGSVGHCAKILTCDARILFFPVGGG